MTKPFITLHLEGPEITPWPDTINREKATMRNNRLPEYCEVLKGVTLVEKESLMD